MPTRHLIWSDECDRPAGTPPNPRWWTHEVGGHGWGNGELQTYTADPGNAGHDGQGHLVIRANRDGTGFTSARLISKQKFEFAHGRLECRAKVPAGQGLWSALWLLGGNIDAVAWPACGEIDVMEHLGSRPERVFGTVHCPGHSGRDGINGDHIARAPLSNDFHLYAVEWAPDRITWSLDEVDYFSVTKAALGAAWVFHHPFYILLNLAVGGWLGGDVGADTVFPAELLVDFIRVYGVA